MRQLYGDLLSKRSLSPSYYCHKFEKLMNQYDITINNNDNVVATSIPLIFTTNPTRPRSSSPKSKREQDNDIEMNEYEQLMREQSLQYGTQLWYEDMKRK